MAVPVLKPARRGKPPGAVRALAERVLKKTFSGLRKVGLVEPEIAPIITDKNGKQSIRMPGVGLLLFDAELEENVPVKATIKETGRVITVLRNSEFGTLQIKQIFDQGGQGKVCEAVIMETGEIVAVKFRSWSGQQNSDLFKRQIEVLEMLNPSPHIVNLLAFDPSPEPIYYVMELLEGDSLRASYFKREHLEANPPDIAQMIGYARSVIFGLADAKRKGLQILDCKESNTIVINVDGKEMAVLIDLETWDFLETPSFSEAGSTLQTPGYSAPESIKEFDLLPVEPNMDIFSTGIVLFHLLAGHSPGEKLDFVNRAQHSPLPEIAFIPDDVMLVLREMTAIEPCLRLSHVEADASLAELEVKYAAASRAVAA
ncbi:MAG: protein kinase [bacterium]